MTTVLTVTRHLLTLADGRKLEFSDCGPATGTVLLHHHIQPGGCLPQSSWARSAVARGLRFVTIARPGYGRSDRQRGRSIADMASDAAAVLDALGAEKAFVSSASGGTPYALACGAKLRERVRAVAVVGPIGPFGEPSFDYIAGLSKENQAECRASLAGEAALRERLEPACAGMLAGCADPEALREHLKTQLPAVDAACLSGELAGDVARGMQDALANGIDGWVDDSLANVSPWGFDFHSLSGLPVSIWAGELDEMIFISHARWLVGQLPRARAHLLPGDGHISIGQRHIDEILDELVS